VLAHWSALQSANPPSNSQSAQDFGLSESFAALSPAFREALTVFYIEGKSVKEAANILGVNEPAMKVRLHRARAALRTDLEYRLEHAVDGLQPSQRFTGSVMGLLSILQGGVLKSGIAGVLGKLALILSAKLWMMAIPVTFFFVAPFAGFVWWQTNLLCNTFQDTPQNQFQKNMIRQAALVGVLLIAATFVTMLFVMRSFGMRVLYDSLALCGLFGIWRIAKFLRVNRTPMAFGGLAMCVTCLIGGAMIGLGVIPVQAGMVLAPIGGIISLFTHGRVPMRRDFNLFLRCATGGLSEDGPGDVSPPPRLTDLELKAFTRFLGEQWLVIDYTPLAEGIVLILPNVRRTMQWSRGSRISVTRFGECHAQVGGADRASIERITGSLVDVVTLETRVSRVVRQALRRFSEGNLDAARSLLTAKGEEDIFQPGAAAATSKRLQSLMIVSIACSALAAALMVLSSAITYLANAHK